MSNNFAIEITDLCYSYKSQWLLGAKPGISNINLQVEAGECFAFLGGNGAGKTTTIKALLGLIKPDKGECKIFGQTSRDPKARNQVGYVSERPYFYDNLTVLELMELYASLVGIKTSAKQKINQALERTGISHKTASRLRGLSKGQTQRVAMAQAILGEPKLLILDEPMSGLDPVARREFRDLLIDLNKNGTTIFMSSHILSEVGSICNKASIMSKGSIKAIINTHQSISEDNGNFEIIISNYTSCKDLLIELAINYKEQNNFLHLIVKNREQANKILEISTQHQAKLQSYNPLRESLEDLFIKLTS
jgi:ABC-2 type transport system ATP-binding protein